LGAQIAYSARVHIAAVYPETKPYLLEGCKLLHCKINLPMQIHEIALESNELQALSQEKIFTHCPLFCKTRAAHCKLGLYWNWF